MAIPTMTNNTPPGGITWGAFTIQLNGTPYGVSSGSTTKRWVWWQYNAGSPSINADDAIPDTLTDDDLVLFANKNGIAARVQSSNFVDGELLVDGSIFADAIAVNQVNTSHIATVGLDAAVVKFGTMLGDRIAANTITAEKLTIGSVGASSVLNGSFEDVSAADATLPARWTRNLVWGGATARVSTASPMSGTKSLELTTVDTVNSASMFSDGFPVIPGQVWAARFRARNTDAAKAGFYCRLRGGSTPVDTVTEVIGNNGGIESIVVPTAITEYAVSFTIPAGMTWARLMFLNYGPGGGAHSLFVDDVEIGQVVISAQIGDNQILATKIKAGEINTAHITATGLDAQTIKFGTMHGDRITLNTLNSNHVVAAGLDAAVVKFGSMHGDRITVNTLNADRIVANSTFTQNLYVASTFTLGTAALSGTLQSYNFAGSATGFQLTNTGFTLKGGTVTGGTFQTATSGQRIQMTGGNAGLITGFSGLAEADVTRPNQIEIDDSINYGIDNSILRQQHVTIRAGAFTADSNHRQGYLSLSTYLTSGPGGYHTSFDVESTNVHFKSPTGDTGGLFTVDQYAEFSSEVNVGDVFGTHLRVTSGEIGTWVSSSTRGGDLTINLGTGKLHLGEVGTGSVGTSTFRDSVDARVKAVAAAGLTSGLNVTGTATITGALTVASGNALTVNQISSASGQINMNNQVDMQAHGLVNCSDVRTVDLYNTGGTTTTNAINTNTNSSGGRILRSTASSERFKTNIRLLEEVDEQAYRSIELMPTVFNYIPEHYDDPTEDVPGIIAERAWDLGLEFLVQVDENDAIETFRYDRLPIYHQLILRKHDSEIAELKADLKRCLAMLNKKTAPNR